MLLRGLSIGQAAAPHDTLVAVTVAVLAGGAILFPSLGLLFGLVLGGHLDHGDPPGRSGAVLHTAVASAIRFSRSP